MKKLFFGVALLVLFACSNETEEQLSIEQKQETLSSDKGLLAQSVAQSIAYNLSNPALKTFLKTEALKMKDGDNDILFVEAL